MGKQISRPVQQTEAGQITELLPQAEQITERISTERDEVA
jgi:hypothetical protein